MTGSTVPFTGLSRQYEKLKDELMYATHTVYSSGNVLNGKYSKKFEFEIAKRCQRKYAVGTNSCSQALLFVYIYYATKLIDRNLALPVLSFVATSNAPTLAGYNLKFVDTTNDGIMDIDRLRLREDKVDLISYVNLYGNILDYDKLKLASSFFAKDIPIIEDAAQSFGATYKGIPSGKLGDVSCLSFDPTKNLPNFGSGGMVLTDNEELYNYVCNMVSNGKASGYTTAGTNSRMSESDCAQMLVKLGYFDEWQNRRRKIAEFYTSCLHAFVDCPTANPDVVHAWHKYVIKTVDRDLLRSRFEQNNISVKVHYDSILYSGTNLPILSSTQVPTATHLTIHSLSLPIYPELTDDEVMRVVKVVQDFYK